MTAAKKQTPRKPADRASKTKPLADLASAANSLADETRSGNDRLRLLEEKLDAVLSGAKPQEPDEKVLKAIQRLGTRLTKIEQRLETLEAPDLTPIESVVEQICGKIEAALADRVLEQSVIDRLIKIENHIKADCDAEREAAETVARAATEVSGRIEERFDGLERGLTVLSETHGATPGLEQLHGALAPLIQDISERIEAQSALMVRDQNETDRRTQVALRLLIDDFRGRMNEIGTFTEEAGKRIAAGQEEGRSELDAVLVKLLEGQAHLTDTLAAQDLKTPRSAEASTALANEIALIRPTLARAVQDVLYAAEVRQGDAPATF